MEGAIIHHPSSVVNSSSRPLRRPGVILLVSCYELGHQPAGVASPAAFLESAGYRPDTLDISVEGFDRRKIARALFVGISVPMHTALRLGVRIARRIRQVNPDCHVCFYGLYAALNSAYLLQAAADSTIGGESEEPLVALVRAVERDPLQGPDIEGVSRRGFASSPFLKRQRFHLPSRRGLPPLERYAHLEMGSERRKAGYVEASRGCLHRCLHCPIPPVFNGQLFVVPAEIVLADVRQQVAAGAAHITFGDPDFLNGPSHSMRIARSLHREFPDLTFDFTAKVEHVLKHRALFPELRKLGCLFMISAVESLSDRVLRNLEKGHSRADVFSALQVVRDSGIAFRPTWVSFTPWTEMPDYLDMLDFVQTQELIEHVDPVQYAVRLLVPPGSSLLLRPQIKPYLGALDPARFSYHWTHPDSRMDPLHRQICAVVEQAVAGGAERWQVFCRVQALACQAGGARVPALAPWIALSGRNPAPRLTEPWFC
ncbi:MAG: radical SAM protein [Acidobacteria bacterium]|nr:radical SAM protein [Acidobacteriota bacterium]